VTGAVVDKGARHVTRSAERGDALGVLARERGGALFGYALLVAGDRSAAEDLVQDALVKVFSRIRQGFTPDDAERYVRRAILTIHLDAHRRSTRWRAVRHLVGSTDEADDDGPRAAEATAALHAAAARSAAEHEAAGYRVPEAAVRAKARRRRTLRAAGASTLSLALLAGAGVAVARLGSGPGHGPVLTPVAWPRFVTAEAVCTWQGVSSAIYTLVPLNSTERDLAVDVKQPVDFAVHLTNNYRDEIRVPAGSGPVLVATAGDDDPTVVGYAVLRDEPTAQRLALGESANYSGFGPFIACPGAPTAPDGIHLAAGSYPLTTAQALGWSESPQGSPFDTWGHAGISDDSTWAAYLMPRTTSSPVPRRRRAAQCPCNPTGRAPPTSSPPWTRTAGSGSTSRAGRSTSASASGKRSPSRRSLRTPATRPMTRSSSMSPRGRCCSRSTRPASSSASRASIPHPVPRKYRRGAS